MKTFIIGGIKDTRLQVKAKDTKKSDAKVKDQLFKDKSSRGLRPWTQPTSVLQKGLTVKNSQIFLQNYTCSP